MLIRVYSCPQARYGSGTGGVIAMGIPLVAMFFCGASSITSNSRWGPGVSSARAGTISSKQ